MRALHRPDDLPVEAVVIANACSDATEDLVRAKMGSFPFDLRLVDEPVAGLNVARNTGARAARGEILAYLDDDAFVEPGWLLGLLRTYDEHPADLVAGKVVLWWEAVERPSWSSPAVERLLSRLDLGPEVIELTKPGQLVGANFAVRREVVERVGGFLPHLDRSGRDLLSGGDTELAARAQRSGYRLFYAPDMAVRHWVAPSRLSLRYLDRLARARGRSRVALSESLGGLEPWRLLRAGFSQTVYGAWQELCARLRGDLAASRSGRLTRHRGAGTVHATLRSLTQRRALRERPLP